MKKRSYKLSERKLHRKHKLSPDFPLKKGIKKSGDNSDRKVILSSEW